MNRIANPKLEINERRLRPIYDYMEIQNYRKALTDIDRLLKKQSSFTACKALKCLVLLKLDRRQEAKQLADEVFQLATATAPTAIAGTRTQQQQDQMVDENARNYVLLFFRFTITHFDNL